MFKTSQFVTNFILHAEFVLTLVDVVVNYLTLTSITSSFSISNCSGVSLPFSSSPSKKNLSRERGSFLNSQ